jgi:hypothetical protein
MTEDKHELMVTGLPRPLPTSFQLTTHPVGLKEVKEVKTLDDRNPHKLKDEEMKKI